MAGPEMNDCSAGGVCWQRSVVDLLPPVIRADESMSLLQPMGTIPLRGSLHARQAGIASQRVDGSHGIACLLDKMASRCRAARPLRCRRLPAQGRQSYTKVPGRRSAGALQVSKDLGGAGCLSNHGELLEWARAAWDPASDSSVS